jgi:nitroreductase
MSKECLGQIRSRRSIRRFSSEPIDEGDIKDIAKIGFSAPSAGNRQPWRIVIVTNQDVKDRLSNAAGGQNSVWSS